MLATSSIQIHGHLFWEILTSWKCTVQAKKPLDSRYDVKLTFVY